MYSPKAKVLIVEDEFLLAEEMKMNLSTDYEVVGIASSSQVAQALLEEHKPDLAILDILLRGQEDGIELAKIINKKFHIPFIFLTSHANSDLVARAMEVKPHSYLLKPYNEYEIPIAIELALCNFEQNKSVNNHLLKPSFSDTENRVMHMRDSLFLKKDLAFQRVKLEDISHLEADNNYTSIYTRKGKFVYSTVLKKIEERLPKSRFMRVHRSHVINLDAISGYKGNMIILDDKRVPVSKQYREEVFSLFSGL